MPPTPDPPAQRRQAESQRSPAEARQPCQQREGVKPGGLCLLLLPQAAGCELLTVLYAHLRRTLTLLSSEEEGVEEESR